MDAKGVSAIGSALSRHTELLTGTVTGCRRRVFRADNVSITFLTRL